MIYSLGAKSLSRLEGVHPSLVKVVMLAIKRTEQDFGVHEGVRSEVTQREYLKRGVTKTLKSKHLMQGDDFGHAVDLVPYVGGALRWEWPLIYPIAAAVAATAKVLSTRIRWGGVWDRPLNDLDGSEVGLRKAVEDYAARHPGPDFLDGPHYELIT